MPTNPYPVNSRRYRLAELCIAGLSRAQAFRECRPMVVAQVEPFVFKTNVAGSRIVTKTISEQLVECRNEIARVYAELRKGENRQDRREDIRDLDNELETPGDDMPGDNGSESPEEIESPDNIPSDDEIDFGPESPDEIEPDDENPDEDEPPKASGKIKLRNELEFFYAEWKRVKAFCETRAEIGESVDSISMRPIVAAKAGIPAGIPARALLHAMTLHWPADIRAQADVETFDFEGFSNEILDDFGRDRAAELLNGEDIHPFTGYALLLAECRIPVMLVGPSGSGKSHIAEQVARLLGVTYAECPLTAGATPSWLLGSWTMQGFSVRPFLAQYSEPGGVFNFEEIDASDPNMLLVVNNALAAKRFFNPVNGETYVKSSTFIPFSTANTYGLGANREFTGRSRLDAATIDRWRMGRIFVGIDEDLAYAILTS